MSALTYAGVGVTPSCKVSAIENEAVVLAKVVIAGRGYSCIIFKGI